MEVGDGGTQWKSDRERACGRQNGPGGAEYSPWRGWHVVKRRRTFSNSCDHLSEIRKYSEFLSLRRIGPRRPGAVGEAPAIKSHAATVRRNRDIGVTSIPSSSRIQSAAVWG